MVSCIGGETYSRIPAPRAPMAVGMGILFAHLFGAQRRHDIIHVVSCEREDL